VTIEVTGGLICGSTPAPKCLLAPSHSGIPLAHQTAHRNVNERLFQGADMKRSLVLALLVFSMNAFAQGQSTFGQSRFVEPPNNFLNLAPAGGLNFTTLKGTEFKTGVGFNGGMQVELGGGHFQLQTGLLYNQFEQVAKYELILADVEYKFRQEYLSIPLLAKVNLSGYPTRSFFFKAGVMPSFLIGSRQEVEVTGLINGTYKSQEKAEMTKTNVFAVGGLGGAISVGAKKDKAVIVEGVWMKSLKKVSSSPGFDGKSEGLAINSGFVFTL